MQDKYICCSSILANCHEKSNKQHQLGSTPELDVATVCIKFFFQKVFSCVILSDLVDRLSLLDHTLKFKVQASQILEQEKPTHVLVVF